MQSTFDFEERADQLSLDDIKSTMVDAEIFRSAKRKLLARGAKLLVGPRGTGKTHLMRFTYAAATKDNAQPLVLYANFNRYLTLEPLLSTASDAIQRFHAWVLAKLLIAAGEHCGALGIDLEKLALPAPLETLRGLIGQLEKGSGHREYEATGRLLTIDSTISSLERLRMLAMRERTVLLLDDAALTLADKYLEEFFRLFRQLKTETVSPKASVYPGSTQYGPTFHASHEVESIQLWISIADPNYSSLMGEIADKRIGQSEKKNTEVVEVLKFMAFGVPRAFLRLLRDYSAATGTVQQRLNTTIEGHTTLITQEYASLGLKLPQFKSIIDSGKRLFDKSAIALREARQQDSKRQGRHVIIGIREPEAAGPLADRMMKFLIEVGMLYPLPTVSHGQDRKYGRYILHLAFLYQNGALRTGRGTSFKEIVDYLGLSDSKHPVRREVATLLTAAEVAAIKLDLPPCQSCGASRLNDSQRYCHNCGKQLLDGSLFEQCIQLPLSALPGISEALLARINQETKIRTVGDVYSSQNPSGDLQQALYIGEKRAQRIINKVAIVVDEFLS
ncbi:hypothetical protein FJV41_44455 [Myxococcus llanfairpwllgwyngyllgogerychwyrndrobwllllantysiliogogogochensis]|uniref:Zinc ribbon domain-containing protein n=1 Tax=Myxococcus llanfairpwllgwyngyllgogerychwyrndrobwllllantysiliogogogochensis TaxID=2590453 RepID=A0A540WKW3_9BACT|nr:hypothetical protein [Myxococcus llanfairpwllgwyngyllgogerychwyrndrobwllllantysiliogogogochensis]TQF09467.1 hypothetical protein FJV41_44455 [Myxococcus llanfairpwllgwyngyllgogerychwyrndrobwllllantysiliogogogochensis]